MDQGGKRNMQMARFLRLWHMLREWEKKPSVFRTELQQRSHTGGVYITLVGTVSWNPHLSGGCCAQDPRWDSYWAVPCEVFSSWEVGYREHPIWYMNTSLFLSVLRSPLCLLYLLNSVYSLPLIINKAFPHDRQCAYCEFLSLRTLLHYTGHWIWLPQVVPRKGDVLYQVLDFLEL